MSMDSSKQYIFNELVEHINTMNTDVVNKLAVYENVIVKGSINNLVKINYDKTTDIVVDDEKLRYELCKKLPHIQDLYTYDCIFEYIRYDLYINFFISVKKTLNVKDPNYLKLVVSAYKELMQTERFTKFYFGILGIKDEIFLQERYLSLVQKFFINTIYKHINYIKPSELILDVVCNNYCSVIEDIGYKYLVKYVNSDKDNLFISCETIRNKVCSKSQITNLYDFETNDLKIITNLIFENYVRTKLNTKIKFTSKKYIEKIIYNNECCINNIKSSLPPNLLSSYDKYIKILVNNIWTMVNF